MALDINQAQFTAISQDHAKTPGAGEPCHDCECDCKKSKGKWTEGPGFRLADWKPGVPNDLSTKYLSSGIPIGVNVHLPVDMTLVFYGTVECSCPEKAQCKSSTKLEIMVDCAVSIPINVAGFALNAIPNPLAKVVAKWAYRGITWGDSAAKAGQAVADKSNVIREGLMPALYTLRDSADLICEGRFDHEKFKAHVKEITKGIKIAPISAEE